jgi:hypothetical protein
MKVRVLDPYQVVHGKTVHTPGDEFTANDTDARAWIVRGYVEEVSEEPVTPADTLSPNPSVEDAKLQEKAVANTESADETAAKDEAKAAEEVKAAEEEAETKAQQTAGNKARRTAANKSAQ